jgi:YD repeat-containing protein
MKKLQFVVFLLLMVKVAMPNSIHIDLVSKDTLHYKFELNEPRNHRFVLLEFDDKIKQKRINDKIINEYAKYTENSPVTLDLITQHFNDIVLPYQLYKEKYTYNEPPTSQNHKIGTSKCEVVSYRKPFVTIKMQMGCYYNYGNSIQKNSFNYNAIFVVDIEGEQIIRPENVLQNNKGLQQLLKQKVAATLHNPMLVYGELHEQVFEKGAHFWAFPYANGFLVNVKKAMIQNIEATNGYNYTTYHNVNVFLRFREAQPFLVKPFNTLANWETTTQLQNVGVKAVTLNVNHDHNFYIEHLLQNDSFGITKQPFAMFYAYSQKPLDSAQLNDLLKVRYTNMSDSQLTDNALPCYDVVYRNWYKINKEYQNGKLINVNSVDANGKLSQYRGYKYNLQGNLMEETWNESQKMIYAYHGNEIIKCVYYIFGESYLTTNVLKLKFENGRKVSLQNSENKWQTFYRYSPRNKLIYTYSTFNPSDGTSQLFDESGNLIYAQQGNRNHYYLKYDVNNRMIEKRNSDQEWMKLSYYSNGLPQKLALYQNARYEYFVFKYY